MTMPSGAYELESSNEIFKRNIIEEGRFSEADYPFTINSKFSTLGSLIEISRQETISGFFQGVSIRDLLFFDAVVI